MTPSPSIPPTGAGHMWTEDLVLHRLYRQSQRDLFSRQELARLSFVRWLYQTGRLQP